MLPLVKSLLAVVGLIALVGLRTTPVHFYVSRLERVDIVFACRWLQSAMGKRFDPRLQKELKLGGGSGRRVPVTGPVESTYTVRGRENNRMGREHAVKHVLDTYIHALLTLCAIP